MEISMIELFSGIGSQIQALSYSKHTCISVATCEVDKDAQLSYAIMHNDLMEKMNDYEFPSKEEMIDYLTSRNIGYNYKKDCPYNYHRISDKKIKSYYLAAILSNNLGDITKVETLPYADLWTYSFPCQDISLAGQKKGIIKGKTRSGLLYEVERLLNNASKKPKYLLMENVKNLIGKEFKGQFDEWCDYLYKIGYRTFYKVLDGKDYGIPQHRERVFAFSIRKDLWQLYNFPNKQPLNYILNDFLEMEVNVKYYLSESLINCFLEKSPKVNTSYPRADRFLSSINRKNQDVCPTLISHPGLKATTTYIKYKGEFQYYGDFTENILSKCNQSFGCLENESETSEESKKLKIYSKINLLGNIPQWHQRGNVYSDKGIIGCLAATDYKTPKLVGFYHLDNQFYIRKITPKESLRLMGFPEEKIQKLLDFGISDTLLYKQAGNSIIVNVLVAIFNNLSSI